MTGLPSGFKVEVEFSAGTWTDITADVDANQPISWHIGRTSPFTDPSSAAVTVTVVNSTGKYTPQRQVLADGVTAHPYWPNVDVRKRIRLSYTISGTQYVRYVGYIKQWLPQLGRDGFQPQCLIVASDRLDQLSRAKLPHALLQEILTDAPVASYQMSEAAGSPAALSSTGKGAPIYLPASQPAALGAANPVPFPDGLTGMQLVHGVGTMPNLSAPLDLGGSQCRAFEAWVTIGGATTTVPMWLWIAIYDGAAPTDGSGNPVFYPILNLHVDNWLQSDGVTFALSNMATVEIDGTSPGIVQALLPYDSSPHHYVVSQTTPGNWSVYYDGVLVASTAATSGNPAKPVLRIWSEIDAGGQQIVLGPVAVYTSPLSAARVAAHYAAGIGNAGETTGARIARLLRYAGLSAAEMNIDTGKETLSAQPTLGKFVTAACQEATTSEGGGAAFYVAPDGRVRFADRTFRKPGAPVLTVDAGADLDAGTFAPSYDELTLVNSSTVSRGGGTTQTFTDSASVNKFNLTTDTATTYATTDQSALNLAQWRVRSQCTPGLRLAAVAVDLLTAMTSGLYQALAAVQIGSRTRVTSLDATASARPTVDMLAEGWTETVAIDQYSVVFDTSAADNPPQMIWDDTTNGRWQADGQTLTSAISASATSLSITTAAGKPRFTTNSAMYPLQIQIGQEVLTLPSAPTGSGAQTFTGVLRGQANTPAAAQAAGSAISLYPASAWTL